MVISSGHVKANSSSVRKFRELYVDDFFSSKFKAPDTFKGHTCKEKIKERELKKKRKRAKKKQN